MVLDDHWNDREAKNMDERHVFAAADDDVHICTVVVITTLMAIRRE